MKWLVEAVKAILILGSIVTISVRLSSSSVERSHELESCSRLDAKDYINRDRRIDQLGRIRVLK